MRIECPNCSTSYPIERTCLKAEAGVRFTIICAVCGVDFDGSFSETPATPDVVTVVRGVPGTPADWVNRWTFGFFGQKAMPAIEDQIFRIPGTPAAVVVDTRKRP